MTITQERLRLNEEQLRHNSQRRIQLKRGLNLLVDGLTLSDMEALVSHIVTWQHMEGWKLPELEQ